MLRHLLGADATAETMLAAIASDARETGRKTGRPVFGAAVMEAMRTVPRAAFVPEAEKPFAYENRPLPIGHRQTISQPFVVALMTELLDVEPGAHILEVGTGCGYQTAILSQLCRWIFTIERIGALLEQARERMQRLGYHNVSFLHGDGFEGWESNSPFDRILVAAAPGEPPPRLLDQLSLGGRMVLPVGGGHQYLRVITRTANGYQEEQREAVRFVPMLRGQQE